MHRDQHCKHPTCVVFHHEILELFQIAKLLKRRPRAIYIPEENGMTPLADVFQYPIHELNPSR